jgi:hypothetical protein
MQETLEIWGFSAIFIACFAYVAALTIGGRFIIRRSGPPIRRAFQFAAAKIRAATQ